MLIEKPKKTPKIIKRITRKIGEKMAGYQFIHVESYARKAGKDKTGGLSVRDVVAEAGREAGNCPHVDQPQPPAVIFGSLDQVEHEVNTWADSMTDTKGRKLRADGLCLLAGVISLPREEEKHWNRFRKGAMEYLHQTYGERLKAVLEHQDEAHPHLHFYVVPKLGERFETVHEGRAAAARARAEGLVKGEQNRAYKEAMRAFQDDFSRKVGQPFGLTRLGPGRRRLTRKAWQAEQAQAKALAEVERTAKKRHEHYKAQGLEAGRQQAQAEAQKLGAKVGAVVTGFASRWHKPSKQAKAEAEAIRVQAQSYADRSKEQAERLVQDERRQRQTAQRELEKQRNITTNTEAENKRLQRELEGYRSTPSYGKSNKFKPT